MRGLSQIIRSNEAAQQIMADERQKAIDSAKDAARVMLEMWAKRHEPSPVILPRTGSGHLLSGHDAKSAA